MLAAGAQLTGRPGLTRAAKLAALGGMSLSTVFLIHDLGRPARFHHMLRVLKLSSPMSVGSWILSAYGPMAGAAAVTNLAGLLPSGGKSTRSAVSAAKTAAGVLGPPATAAAAVSGPRSPPTPRSCCATRPYRLGTRHTASRPTCSGLGRQRGRRLWGAGRSAEGAGARPAGHYRFRRRTCRQEAARTAAGDLAEPYLTGRANTVLRVGEVLTVGGLAGAALSRRSRLGSALSGVALLAASALTRYGIFEAGMASARDPKYTVVPQRKRQQARQEQQQARQEQEQARATG